MLRDISTGAGKRAKFQLAGVQGGTTRMTDERTTGAGLPPANYNPLSTWPVSTPRATEDLVQKCAAGAVSDFARASLPEVSNCSIVYESSLVGAHGLNICFDPADSLACLPQGHKRACNHAPWHLTCSCSRQRGAAGHLRRSHPRRRREKSAAAGACVSAVHQRQQRHPQVRRCRWRRLWRLGTYCWR